MNVKFKIKSADTLPGSDICQYLQFTCLLTFYESYEKCILARSSGEKSS